MYVLINFLQITIRFVTILCSIFIYTKIMNFKFSANRTHVYCVAFSIVLAGGVFLLRELLPYFRYILLFLAVAIFIAAATKTRFELTLSAVIISVGISYGVFMIFLVISTICIEFALGEDRYVLATITAIAMQCISISCLFKIKRFSRGIPFLKKKAAGAIGCMISGAIILIFVLINRGISPETAIWVLVGIALCVMGLIIWWRRGITLQYRERVKERNAQDYEKIIEEKELQIEKLRVDNEVMSNLLHRDNKLLPALCAAVILFMESDNKTVEDGAHLLGRIEMMLEERTGILASSLNHNEMLPSTMNLVLRGILHYMMIRASEEGVQFDIAELSDFSELADTIIPATKLYTVLADLIENAINATYHCEVKKVMISLSSDKGVFELCIQDSGIPFETDTLVNIGVKKASARIHEGGSGIGYMTVFEILREYKASLIIIEYEQEQSTYTKSISIRFDEKKEYTLITGRAEEIKAAVPKTTGRNDLFIMGYL